MSFPLFVVDAFTAEPFAGNPAAVCLLPGPASEGWMQQVAAEMNLSETAFLHVEGDDYRLRWFTPAVEVDLCGHATLAAAHALWECGKLAPTAPATFQTRSGLLTVRKVGEQIALDFPALATTACAEPAGFVDALGCQPTSVHRTSMDFLVELKGRHEVEALRPDFRRLATAGVRGIIVTAPSSTSGIDFVSRFFAPGAGIDEDPVTGSVHCALAPFWGDRLGKREMVGYQASKRGGTVHVALQGDRVILRGHAVTVLRGQLL